MPLQPCQDDKPHWVTKLPVYPGDEEESVENRLSRAIELSEEEGLGYLSQLRSRVGLIGPLENDSRGWCAVHIAVLCKRYATLRALLTSGLVDIDQPSTNAAKKGWTALHLAAFQMDLNAIHILLDHDCNVTLRTKLGSTPLHFVTGRFGNRGPHLQPYIKSIMLALVQAQVDPETTNEYGYTVMHEVIMWNDMTSLCVLLELTTTDYFGNLPLIGCRVLPHELAGRSAIPGVMKRTLETIYYSLRRKKESAGVKIPELDTGTLHLMETLYWVSNPSPPTVERINFPHPESLTAGNVGSLLPSESPNLVVGLLKRRECIVEYEDYTSREIRYAFPAYYRPSPASWVCTNCRDCHVVAGRWFGFRTEPSAKGFLLHLMPLVLSKFYFPSTSALSSSAYYFSSTTGVQLALRYADFVRSQGVIIQTCSSSSSSSSSLSSSSSASDYVLRDCRNLLDAVVELAYQVHVEAGPHAVVSSRDLREEKKIPHLFSLSEISQAVAGGRNFLSNPASMHMAETFVDLLLPESPSQLEAVECDGGTHDVIVPTLPCPVYNPSDEWSQDLHGKGIKHHREDVISLIDPDVMTDYLVKRGAISQSDANYITSERRSREEEVLRLLEVVEREGVYHHCFSILRETGDVLPTHGRLWDILDETCNKIHASGSLNNFYLDQEDTLPSHSVVPPSTDDDDVPGTRDCESRAVPDDGRVTAESGYGTHPSVPSFNVSRSTLSRSLPSQMMSSRDSHAIIISALSPPTHQSTRLEQDIVPSMYECRMLVRSVPPRRHSATTTVAPYSTGTELASGHVSAPISIPRKRSSSHSSPTNSPSSNTVQDKSAAKLTRNSPTHKHLSSGTARPTSLWERFCNAVFSPAREETTPLGIKLQ